MSHEEITETLLVVESALYDLRYKDAEGLCRQIINTFLSDKIVITSSDHDFTLISLKSKAYQMLSNSLWRQGQLNEALTYGNQALIYSKEINNLEAIAAAASDLGNIYRMKSDFITALEFFNTSLSYYESIRQVYIVPRILSNIGSIYMELSNFKESLIYFKKALTIGGDLDKKLIAGITGNIGILYMFLTDYPSALEFHNKSLSAYEELGENYGMAKSLGNIACSYYHMSDYQQAKKYYTNALSFFEELGNEPDIAISIGNIGSVFFSLQDFDNALELFLEALNKFGQLDMKGHVAGMLANIGSIYKDLEYYRHDFEKAEVYYLKAITINTEIGSKNLLLEDLKNISSLYEHNNDSSKALEYFKKYHELTIEVQNEEVKKQADKFAWERKIADMEKEKEIEFIKTEADKRILNETIAYQKNTLETQAREVENTIQELVKKNDLLQQIQSDIKKITPHTRKEGIEFIEHLLDRVTRHITPLNSDVDKDWADVHSKFISILQHNFPDLTTMELKIAALLNMKFTSSNIGSALFLSKRTVEFHRHNLRKKMHIDTNQDIYLELAKYST